MRRWRPIGLGLLAVLSLLALSVPAPGCNGDDPAPVPVDYIVTYTAWTELDGQARAPSAELTRIVYTDDQGDDVEVLDPANDPWTRQIVLSTGDVFFLRGEGTLADARILLQVEVVRSGEVVPTLIRSALGMPYGTGDRWAQIAPEALP